MKKLTVTIISSSLIVGLCITSNISYATDFTGQEDKYIEICKSSTLSANEQETCREFNIYLKNKNQELQEQISGAKSKINTAKDTLDEIDQELTTLKNSIHSKETEISYLETSITNLEASITKKEEAIKERMYTMQTYVNSNFYLDFIFGASDFADMISRIDNINELTSYDKDLIFSLLLDKEDLQSQQDTMVNAKANLEANLATQETLQNQYLALYQEQNAELIANEKESMLNTGASLEIDDNLAALAAASKESEVSDVTDATPPTNPSPPSTSDDNNVTDGGGNGNSGDVPAPPEDSGNYQTGLHIANAALSKQGSPYVWGASGPNSFDCSGLVWWAHRQAGINFTRTSASVLASMGKPVAYNELQAGDIITFKTNPTYVSHVGIYIGNGMMVHAPTFNIPVQVVSITSSYWQNCYYNARRLY